MFQRGLKKQGGRRREKEKKKNIEATLLGDVRTISTPQVLDGEGCWLVAWDSDTLYFSKYLRNIFEIRLKGGLIIIIFFFSSTVERIAKNIDNEYINSLKRILDSQ